MGARWLLLLATPALAAMPGGAVGRFFSYGFILQLVAIVHFIRRRPSNYWIWIILFFGAIGAAVYIVVEMLPDLALMRHSVKGLSRRKRIRTLEAAVLDNPSPGNYEELGDLLLEEKRFARARDCYDRALGQRTDSVDPFYRRGIAAFQLGDYGAALIDFERVMRDEPKYDFARVQLFDARALAAAGRMDEAERMFQQLLQNSSTTEALCAAAEFLAGRGRTAEARQLAERILARRAAMPAYQKRLERSWLRRASALARQ